MTNRSGRDTRARPWAGAARFGQAWAAFVGITGDNALHRHHAIQAFAGQDLRVFDRDGAEAAGDGFVVPPDVWHRITTLQEGVFLYIDPGAPGGRAIANLLKAGMHALLPDEARSFRVIVADALADGDAADPIGRLMRLLGLCEASGDKIDPRIESLLEQIAVADPPILDSGGLAASLGLSRSRLVHLFTDSVGIPLRSFLLWTKLRRAFESIAAGSTLTEAAHSGGFADSAHFSRTCRAKFGINPRALTGGMVFRP